MQLDSHNPPKEFTRAVTEVDESTKATALPLYPLFPQVLAKIYNQFFIKVSYKIVNFSTL